MEGLKNATMKKGKLQTSMLPIAVRSSGLPKRLRCVVYWEDDQKFYLKVPLTFWEKISKEGIQIRFSILYSPEGGP